MDSAIAFELLSQRHRPPTAIGRRPAILELYRQGLRPRDIAGVLQLDLTEVLEAVRASDERADARASCR